MTTDKLREEYADRFKASLKDPVEFARLFLDFQPYPYQTKFLRDQSPKIVACCGRQVGKTTLAAVKALHFALSEKLVLVLIVSPGLRQSTLLFDKILGLIEVCIPAKLLLRYNSRTKVSFANRSEIIALPCGELGKKIRGFTADMTILDEANFMPKGVINSVIRPTMITKPKAKLIMMSTPWTKNHPFYEALTKPSLRFERYTWPTSMNPQVTAAQLELERKTIGELEYNREYNAQFLDEEFAYFPSNLVLSCTDDYELNPDLEKPKSVTGQFYIGIDFGKHTDHSTIIILNKTWNDPQTRLVYMKEFQLETQYNEIIGCVKLLRTIYHFTAGCSDQTGVGEAPVEAIQQFMPNIKGLTLTAKTKIDLMGKLKLAMENHQITFPRDPRLLAQINSQQCKPSESGKLLFTHPSKSHDDLLWALALAYNSTLEKNIINLEVWKNTSWRIQREG